jgi:uncharacterized protein (DUF1778 family)
MVWHIVSLEVSMQRDVFVTFRVTEAERAAIKAAADQVRRSSSDLVRIAALEVAAQLTPAQTQPETKGGHAYESL